MRTNVKTVVPAVHTHEGGVAVHIDAERELRRSLMTCMLWEDTFYEDGISIADRLKDLILKVSPAKVAELAVEAREQMHLRHAPLLIVRQMASLPACKPLVADTLTKVIKRADEMAEFLSLYWKDGKCKISAQVKKGLAACFEKFDEYAFGKYKGDGNAITLRDVMFLTHPKPADAPRHELYKKIASKTLETPDTWETQLSAGKDKKETWERLMTENKLGAFAFIRNLRNMKEVGVSPVVMNSYALGLSLERILPYRFIAAARAVPEFEPMLEPMMMKCLEGKAKLPGRTILLVDVSGSMDSAISSKSDLMRIDAACGLAILARELCETVNVVTFSNMGVVVPPRRGFALRDAIVHSQEHSGTYLGRAVTELARMDAGADRIIVITDEQSHDQVPAPAWKRAYLINVAAYQRGVGYRQWTHIDGWSEKVLDYIQTFESSKD